MKTKSFESDQLSKIIVPYSKIKRRLIINRQKNLI